MRRNFIKILLVTLLAALVLGVSAYTTHLRHQYSIIGEDYDICMLGRLRAACL